ncbi:MAG: SpoIIE family protein phosphatase [Clostridiales bacterium]|nr:SpoIIE family protein phosphatase [Clostridiales bacterium]
MEELIRKLETDSVAEKTEKGAKRLNFSLLVPDIVFMLFSALVGSFSPFDGVSPFGTACVIAAWYSGFDPVMSCLGASAGYFLSGNYAYGSACVLMGVGLFFAVRYMRVRRLYRLLLAFALECVLNLIAALVFKKSVILFVGSATVSVLGAVVISNGIKGIRYAVLGRRIGDTELMTMSALLGLVALSFGTFRLFGQSLGVIFSALSVLFFAYRFGVPAVAAAVTLGAGRMLATGGDMHFIAVLASTALIAASVRSLGKWATLFSFAAITCAITFILEGNGVISYFECAAAGLIFALVPAKLYMPENVREELRSPNRQEPKYSALTYRVASLSEVLSELARVYGGETAELLSPVAKSLKNALSPADRKSERFRTEYGISSVKKRGSAQSGDSTLAKTVDGFALFAVSDGMGTGDEAGRESRAALSLLGDLISVGFTLDDAVNAVNSLLFKTGTGDMYATLDVVFVDLNDGSAEIKKHGAPPSLVMREGRIFTLSGSSLPVGIIECAEGESRTVALRDGDMIVMMTDGVSEALGSDLYSAVTEALQSQDAEKAAERLLESAAARGGDDDMTVLTARVTR